MKFVFLLILQFILALVELSEQHGLKTYNTDPLDDRFGAGLCVVLAFASLPAFQWHALSTS